MIISGSKNQIITKMLSLPDKDYTVEVREKGDNRGLTANRYYWHLVHEYAVWSKHSDAYIHNDIMSRFGEDDTLDGKLIYVVMPDNEIYMEYQKIHLRPTTEVKVGTDGTLYRTFIKRADSHTLNTKQFARLIDGLIQEIQGSDAPIETMTPRQLLSLKGYQ